MFSSHGIKFFLPQSSGTLHQLGLPLEKKCFLKVWEPEEVWQPLCIAKQLHGMQLRRNKGYLVEICWLVVPTYHHCIVIEYQTNHLVLNLVTRNEISALVGRKVNLCAQLQPFIGYIKTTSILQVLLLDFVQHTDLLLVNRLVCMWCSTVSR